MKLLYLFILLGLLTCHCSIPVAKASAPTVNTTTGCLESYDPTIDYFPEKAQVRYAKGFTLTYFKHYKVLDVLKPWPGANKTFRYVLVQCGAPVPEGFSDAQIITIPVQRIAVLSTTHLPHLTLLNELDSLVAVSDFENVNTPAVRRKIAAHKLVDIGHGPVLNTEILLDLAPDLVIVVGHLQPQDKTYSTLQQADVQVAINAESVESSLLGRSEWLKFTAAFFNKDGLAQHRFADIAQQFQRYAALTEDIKPVDKPTVFVGSLYRDVWYMPGGASYMAELLAVAGGRYLWAADSHRGGVPLNFEAVFERAVDADIWFTSDLDWMTRADLLAANERYRLFKAFQNGRIYNNNVRVNQQGGNDFWESGIMEPHILLADVIKILHSERLPSHRLKYYRRLP
jgi:iron complex transport system substrate-binding protein